MPDVELSDAVAGSETAADGATGAAGAGAGLGAAEAAGAALAGVVVAARAVLGPDAAPTAIPQPTMRTNIPARMAPKVIHRRLLRARRMASCSRREGVRSFTSPTLDAL